MGQHDEFRQAQKDLRGSSRTSTLRLRRYKARVLAIGVFVFCGVVAVCVAQRFWRADDVSETQARGKGNGELAHLGRPSSDLGLGVSRTAFAVPGQTPLPAEPKPVPETGASASEPVPLPPESKSVLPKLDYLPPTTVDALQKEAFEVAARLAKDYPNKTDPIGLLGMVHIHLGNAVEAMECWRQCLKLDPNRADVYLAMGRLSLNQEKYREAASQSRKAMELDPQLPMTRSILAQALLGLGTPREAVSLLKHAIKISSDAGHNGGLSEHYRLLGKSHQLLGEREKAREDYQKAIQIDPQSAEAHYGLATVCRILGQRDEARQHLEKFQALRSKNLAAYMSRRAKASDAGWVRHVTAKTHIDAASVYRAHGRLREAEEHWRKAALLEPNNVVCRRELARLYERTGGYMQSMEICRQLVEIEPKKAVYHLNIGILYARMNRIGAALVSVRRAMELNPGNAKYREVYKEIQEAD